ncbi:MAG: hypothetical protein KF800_14705 [Lysobacter sp.]|nr:hypothetical protein [Lysobacter sp.]
MGRRERTVTAMGLPARDEAELRRLLEIVAGLTRAHWSFLDAIDADVAFCEPRSALARVYLHHRNVPGVPVCIALGAGGEDLPWPHRVPLPLDPSRLQAVLDRIDALEAGAIAEAGDDADATALDPDAGTQAAEVEVAPPTASAIALMTDPASPEGVAMDIDRGEVVDFGRDFIEAACAVQARMRDEAAGAVWRFEWGGRAFDVFFPERAYRYDGDASTDMLMAMGVSMPVGPARRLGPAEAVSARHVGHQKPLDPLLWRIGLHMPPRAAMPWTAPGIRVRLRRWPDFGHLGAHRPHFAIAAHMSRSAWAADDLARASGQDLADVHAFLNACGLCGLLEIEQGAQPAPPPEPPQRVSGLFRRLRDALGIGA